MKVDDCRIIDLPKIADVKGNLTPVYNSLHVPFDIARVYYTYDIPGGEARGGHAHRACEEFVVAAMGSFDVVVYDGFNKKKFSLNRAYHGLYLPKLVWRELENFSSGAVCLVLASMPYDEPEYVRDMSEFLRLKGAI